MWDGVSEWTKTSVATSTSAGSKPRPWVAFFFGKVTVSEDKCPHLGMADTYWCPLKNLPNCVNVLNLQYPPTQLKITQMA